MIDKGSTPKSRRMHKKERGPFREPEGPLHRRIHNEVWWLVGIYALLVTFGLANLYSASLGGDYFFSQTKNAVIAIVVFLIVGWIIPIRWWNDYAYYLYGAVVVSLAAVIILGHSSGGSQRWLKLGPIVGQPSEFAKIFVAIAVARFFHFATQEHDYRLRDLWAFGLIVSLVFILIFVQPDFGTAGICALIGLTQLAMLRINKKSILIVLASTVPVAIFSWFLFLREYQKKRILTLLSPDADPTGHGYNSLQSLIAVGSGKLFGKGFMQGTQSQLQFLPARHTDFIFSVFAEEQGFWMSVALFLLITLLIHFIIQIARLGRDTFASLLAIGIAAYFFFEYLINVAMVLGVFPVVGMPLPFFSHGGSAFIAMSMGLGLVVAVHRAKMNTRLHKTELN